MQAFSTRVGRNAVPLKPVEVSDQYGFRSALYAVNALQKRIGESAYTEHEARVLVANLIRDSNVSKLSLLIRQWYSEQLDESAFENVVRELANRIINNDESRYEDTVVNNIEWSAMATSFKCCIAVKFVGEGFAHGGGNGWKIAVPTPQIFGQTETYDADSAQCVFVVCQKVRGVSKYVALIPSSQPIFKPGRALVRSKSEYEAAVGGSEATAERKVSFREEGGETEPTSSAASSAGSETGERGGGERGGGEGASEWKGYGMIDESVLQQVNEFAVLGARLAPVDDKAGDDGRADAGTGVMYEMRLLFQKAFPDAPTRSANKVSFLH